MEQLQPLKLKRIWPHSKVDFLSTFFILKGLILLLYQNICYNRFSLLQGVDNMPKTFFNRFFYFSLSFILIGIVALFLPHTVIRHIFRYVVGLSIVAVGFYKLIFSNIKALGKREFIIDIVEGFISIIIGVCSINFYYSETICLILGAIYLVMPIFRVIISENKLNQFFMDLLKYIFAGYIITNTVKIPIILKVYVALTFIGIGVGIMIYRFVYYKRNMVDEDEELF